MQTPLPERQETSPAADPIGYETWYLRYLTLQRISPHLAHKDHEPDPRKWGLNEREATFIRVRVERDYNRKY
jgi:hypothetical protein